MDEMTKMAMIADNGTGEDYIVLSHCWGTPTKEEKKRFCTTRENYEHRWQGFSYGDLPKTFRDAVQTTREFQKQYLWIDSLCIIQEDKDDWRNEARKMENFFASAYCTIAASSACGWGDGFLKPDPDSQYIGFQVRLVPATSTKRWIKEPLARELGFYKNECCPAELSILPPRTRIGSVGRECDMRTSHAIYGLVQRIGRVLSAEARYGIVRCFLSSLLLWRRSDDQKPIDYGDRTVPSWSWMAYSGGIDFISDVKQRLMIPEFAELDFADDSEALAVKIRRFENCRIDQDRKQFTVFARSRSGPTREVGSLWFDVTDRIDFRHCVIVGMVKDTQETYYILVVQEEASGGGYERLGVGKVEAR
ncbi:unnamed protein product [Clonostachys chloroleuca]|uniref:Heterokaryon incompatibility domain-containing protein n=1 Tax=Clonostachys chloroleuca TaxID=1926264 RepID=A0AA35M7I3_9HYPO|nr:unnamed protein product [Clonostachys chloroleuca]